MSDLRELLAEAIANHTEIADPTYGLLHSVSDYFSSIHIVNGIFPIIEQKLAEATADALEAARQECDRHAEFCKAEAHKGGDFQHLMTRRGEAEYLASRIRALIAADIAAKAKERDKAIDTAGWKRGYDERAAIAKLDTDWTPEKLAAHDAKIRREAYLRCADAIAPGWYEDLAGEIRRWANEADGGGK